jgi:hypothetical protein
MAKNFRFVAQAIVPVAACSLAIWLASAARAQDHTQLTGHWNFNADQSDDADQKVHDAQQNSQRSADNGGSSTSGGGYPGGGGGWPGGGGGWPGGGGGWPGGGGRGGAGRGRGGVGSGNTVSSQEWDRLAENPKFLRIDQRSDQVVIIDDADHAKTFYPDGKKHDDKDANGAKITTKASWQGSDFVAETKLPHSQKLTETFRLSDDGKQLYVTTRFDAPALSWPLSIRRVYDLTKAPAQ